MDLDGTPFRAFVKVAEHASFTRAAQDLHISQPALSAMIKEMERRLGFALFTRTSRRVALTREGRALIVNAKRVVLEHDWAAQRAREIRSNDLRLAAPHNSTLIAERLTLTERFAAQFPQSRVEVLPLDMAGIYDAVREDDADLGLTLEPAGRQELSPINASLRAEFETQVLASRPVGLLVPAGHPLGKVACAAPDAIAGLTIATIGRAHGGPISSAILRRLTELGADVVRTGEGDAISLMRYAAREGIAVTDIGWFDMARPAVAPGLTRVGLEGCGLATDLVMLRHPRAQRSLAERFWSFAGQMRASREGGSGMFLPAADI